MGGVTLSSFPRGAPRSRERDGMRRRYLLGIAVGVAVALAVGWRAWLAPTGPKASPSRPNVVLISMDTTRADHLSCFGYPKPTSPNLDRLAARGVRFAN